MVEEPRSIELNGICYKWPRAPVAVICVDGGDPEYFDHAIRAGLIPNIKGFMEQGFSAIAQGTVPSFTNPNNVSIITGAPPAVHGISGNFYLNRDTGEAVMMTGPELLRCETLLSLFSRAGLKVAAVTAKDKLRAQLGRGLDFGQGSICFSAQCADVCVRETHGIDEVLGYVGLPLPEMYSAELSLFCLEAGVKLLSDGKADLLYLSLTDYIQHKYAPGAPEANDFYKRLDEAVGRLAAEGALVAITADHGMSDKAAPDGTPNVIWLQDVLDEALGPGVARVICPITDPFVAHHGALGGFVRVYCEERCVERVVAIASGLAGVEQALTRDQACLMWDLPPDREGDVVVVSDRGTALGASFNDHDLSELAGLRLRTHGGTAEARVPFILSRPLTDNFADEGAHGTLRSHDIFRFALNGCVII